LLQDLVWDDKKTRTEPSCHASASDLWEPLIITDLSLPRRRESSDFKNFWIPVFAGMTFLEVALFFLLSVDTPFIPIHRTGLSGAILVKGNLKSHLF
jgi:hypothetical protein